MDKLRLETPETIDAKRRLQESATQIAASMLANEDLCNRAQTGPAVRIRIAIVSVDIAKEILNAIEKED
jgi:hypothetical protein